MNSHLNAKTYSGLSCPSELEALPELDVEEEDDESSNASFMVDFGQQTLQTCVNADSSGS